MTETPEEFRRRVEQIDAKFYEDADKRGAQYRERAFEYEKLTVDFSHKGFQTLTYLNGGALVAIPTAMAFFRADVSRIDVLWTAGAFIAGLLCVVLAQVCAFFTMSKRAEANQFWKSEQFQRVAALAHPPQTESNLERIALAQRDRAAGLRRERHSNYWRLVGLVFFFVSLIVFVVGCVLGAKAVIVAKDRMEPPSTMHSK